MNIYLSKTLKKKTSEIVILTVGCTIKFKIFRRKKSD